MNTLIKIKLYFTKVHNSTPFILQSFLLVIFCLFNFFVFAGKSKEFLVWNYVFFLLISGFFSIFLLSGKTEDKDSICDEYHKCVYVFISFLFYMISSGLLF